MRRLVKPEPDARPDTDQDGNGRPGAEDERELERRAPSRSRRRGTSAGAPLRRQLTSARPTDSVSSARRRETAAGTAPAGARRAARRAHSTSCRSRERLPLDIDESEPVEMPDEPQHVGTRLLGGERERLGQLAHDHAHRPSDAGEYEGAACVEWPRVPTDRVGQTPALEDDARSERDRVCRGDHQPAPPRRTAESPARPPPRARVVTRPTTSGSGTPSATSRGAVSPVEERRRDSQRRECRKGRQLIACPRAAQGNERSGEQRERGADDHERGRDPDRPPVRPGRDDGAGSDDGHRARPRRGSPRAPPRVRRHDQRPARRARAIGHRRGHPRRRAGRGARRGEPSSYRAETGSAAGRRRRLRDRSRQRRRRPHTRREPNIASSRQEKPSPSVSGIRRARERRHRGLSGRGRAAGRVAANATQAAPARTRTVRETRSASQPGRSPRSAPGTRASGPSSRPPSAEPIAAQATADARIAAALRRLPGFAAIAASADDRPDGDGGNDGTSERQAGDDAARQLTSEADAERHKRRQHDESAADRRHQDDRQDRGDTARRACRDLGTECRSPGERDGKHRPGDHRRQQRPERDPVGDAGVVDRADELGSQSLPGAVQRDRERARQRARYRRRAAARRRPLGADAEAGSGRPPQRASNAPRTLSRRRPSPSAVRKTSSSEEAACRARNAPGSPRSSTTPRWRRTIS